MKLPRSAGASAYCEALEPYRVALFEHLRICDPCVRHVAVHGGSARKARTGADTATNRLVVPKVLVAEKDVVHGALTPGGQAKGLEEHVHDALAGLDIAANDRRAAFGIRIERRCDDAVLRQADLHRLEQPLVERQRLVHQQAEHV